MKSKRKKLSIRAVLRSRDNAVRALRNEEKNRKLIDDEFKRLCLSVEELDREVVKLRMAGPIPMIFHCPACGRRHIDEGEFAEKPHHTHACQRCGFVWRPAISPTVGVRFLPGFKNKE